MLHSRHELRMNAKFNLHCCRLSSRSRSPALAVRSFPRIYDYSPGPALLRLLHARTFGLHNHQSRSSHNNCPAPPALFSLATLNLPRQARSASDQAGESGETQSRALSWRARSRPTKRVA